MDALSIVFNVITRSIEQRYSTKPNTVQVRLYAIPSNGFFPHLEMCIKMYWMEIKSLSLTINAYAMHSSCIIPARYDYRLVFTLNCCLLYACKMPEYFPDSRKNALFSRKLNEKLVKKTVFSEKLLTCISLLLTVQKI